MNTMNIAAIQEVLPERYPLLMVDRILEAGDTGREPKKPADSDHPDSNADSE